MVNPLIKRSGRRSGLMVSALDSGSSGPSSRPGQGHCVVFIGQTLHSHSAVGLVTETADMYND